MPTEYFEVIWLEFAERKNVIDKDENQLIITVGSLKQLASQFYDKGFSAGLKAESKTKSPNSDDFLKDLLRGLGG